MRIWIAPPFIKRWLVVSLCLSGWGLWAQSSVSISSDRQRLAGSRFAVFTGNVRATLGPNNHVTAAQVAADLHKHSFTATDASWSGCGHTSPHWRMSAQKATFDDNWLTMNGVRFQVGNVPLLYLPWLQFPVKHMFSGSSLLPSFSYDAVHGFGVRHHLMMRVARDGKMALGVDWRSRRGAMLNVNVSYQGSGLRPLLALQGRYRTQGWQATPFIDSDEQFVDTLCTRWQGAESVLSVAVRREALVRDQRASLLATRRALGDVDRYEERVVYYVPQVRFCHTFASSWLPISGSVECGADWTVVRGQYMGRLLSGAVIDGAVNTPIGLLSAQVRPYLQGRVHGYAVPHEVPAVTGSVEGSVCLATPFVTGSMQWFDGAPALQEYQIDEYEKVDRGVVATLAGSWRGVTVAQPVALGRRDSLPYRLRSPHASALLPAKITVQHQVGGALVRSEHQFCWQASRFVQHELCASLKTGAAELDASLVQVDDDFARARQLFCGGAAFVRLGAKCYIGQSFWWWVRGAWTHEVGTGVMRRLSHEVGASYRGHCWTVTAGYKNNRYLQYARHRTQWSVYLKVAFTGLGTLGATVKQWLYN